MTMDLQNLQLQQQLHEQNQRRMATMEEEQLRQGKVLAEILSNTASLPTLVARVNDLESSRDKERGVIALLVFIWSLIEAYFHFNHR